ncbi:MAG: hypothetical protein ACKO1R_02175, partial [Crocinitomicaceae bacterium]
MLLLIGNIFAQEKSFTIAWKNSSELIIRGNQVYQPQFEQIHLDNGRPLYYLKEKASRTKLSNFINYTSQLAEKKDIEYFNSLNINVPEELDLHHGIRNERGESYFVISFFPFVKKEGKVHRINSLNFSFSDNSIQQNKDFVSESALKQGNGTWYKISVSKDGLYKIDRTFLENCGINVST